MNNKEKLNTLEQTLIDLGNPEICEKLLPHIYNLEIVHKADLMELLKSVKDKKCNFYYKCKKRKSECGSNLPAPFQFLTASDKPKYRKKEDGEE